MTPGPSWIQGGLGFPALQKLCPWLDDGANQQPVLEKEGDKATIFRFFKFLGVADASVLPVENADKRTGSTSLSGILCVRHAMSTEWNMYAEASQKDAESQRVRASCGGAEDTAGIA